MLLGSRHGACFRSVSYLIVQITAKFGLCALQTPFASI